MTFELPVRYLSEDVQSANGYAGPLYEREVRSRNINVCVISIQVDK